MGEEWQCTGSISNLSTNQAEGQGGEGGFPLHAEAYGPATPA